MRSLSLLVVVVAVVGLSGVADAQSENKAAAEAAFQKGKQLDAAGQTAEACVQFARSQELDPQLGTQYNLALCYEKIGKLASAWGELSELAAKDTNKKRKADAAKRSKALAPRLTHMVLDVAEPAAGLVVLRGELDVTRLVGIDTPVDPGVYGFVVSAPGRVSWQAEIDLTAEGATVTIDVPRLELVPVLDGDGDGDGGGDGDGDGDGGGDGHGDGDGNGDRARPVEGGRDPGKGRRLIGLSVAGAGVIVTGIGLVFGLQAKGFTDDAKTVCGGDLDPCGGDLVEAQGLIDDARGKATLSNVFIGVGLAAVAAGVVIWVTAPERSERSVALRPIADADGFGLALDGRF